ncbi:TetR/AcrR family transcriptional regulator [Microbacterium sp. STN6]|uniref:TetR/AcrR family transcriptional regulator n=1 Tax=Microbacterium sp. STN6 TaxID=2995588 RepID=UPI002260911B|nr:TetR/AcrR family transcriptional regulator [Microbacterium sp. STN6]MCX7522230.1 TetR/AcrR family transcriptional regulator [Microbacterium sp. STN6]
MTAHEGRVGRRRASSRAMLEEAACELFLEQTYAGTTIEQITQRAGVSRNTFFNYFAAKSDVLWSGVDDSVETLARELSNLPRGAHVMLGVRDALLATATQLTPGAIPLAITQWETMGVAEELQSSGLARFLRLASVLERHVAAAQLGSPARVPAQPAAFAVIAAAASAAGAWARAGIGRDPLVDYVAAAITPVCSGFEQVLGSASR